MKNIFNTEDNNNLQKRLLILNSDSERAWGKMTVSQMLLHCQKPFEVAEQKLLMKRNLISFLFGKMAKKSLLKDEGFKKNLPTAKEFIIQSSPDFETEKTTLLHLITTFGQRGSSVVVNKKHPFFGEMTEEEWGVLFYKHLDHHMTQFGV